MNRQLPPGRAQGQAPRMPPQTHGPIQSVPCPHCGKTNDLREFSQQQLMDTGHEFDCQHCHRLYEVAQIYQVTVVAVRPSLRQARRQEPQARPARTISPAQLKRLLR